MGNEYIYICQTVNQANLPRNFARTGKVVYN